MRSILKSNVAVVGGAGFLGSHLVNYLIDVKQCNVLVLDNLINGRREFIHPKAKFVWCDITGSEENLYKLFRKFEVDFVFNYAAEPYIPVSFERPLHVFNINAFGALKVINAAHEAGAKAILQVSSAEIYGESKGKLDETALVRPHSTYGASKMAIDALVQARWRESGTPVIAMRQFNCVGERETHKYVIPEIINQIAKLPVGDEYIQLGNNSSRDFQYAGDAVCMATELIEKGEFGEVYNMGSEETIKIYDLATLIGSLMGKKIKITVDQERVRPWEIWHLQSDNTKLYKVISARPQINLTEALKRTINDYEQNGFTFL